MIEIKHIFKRKLYQRLLEWKREEDGRTAILIEGARLWVSPHLPENLEKTNMKAL